MKSKYNSKQFVQNILAQGDIQIDGNRPWDITVHNEKFYNRLLSQGSLGLGESYMDGWWDSQSLDQFFFKVFRSKLDQKTRMDWYTFYNIIRAKLINLQSKERAFEVGEHHYDLDNNLFKLMLDNRMVYSCAYWKHASNIDQAQENKLELICKKLQLKAGLKVLDLGCGWGGLARYAAEKYNCHVTGITVSKEQAHYAQSICSELPVTIKLQDYRDLDDVEYDRIVSVGMFEHVGPKNHFEFIQIVHKHLKDDGIFLLHTIGRNSTSLSIDPWLSKYIFPNTVIPSMLQISKAIEGLFVMEDWHNFGTDYDKTLIAWHDRFIKNWPKLNQKYDQRFYRMWNYYLLGSAGAFRARHGELWQLVLTKNGLIDGYTSIR